MMYSCDKKSRKQAVLEHATLNGIDYIEVLDSVSMPVSKRQRFLRLHFLKPLANPIAAGNIQVTGGVRIRNISVIGVSPVDGHVLEIELNQHGDFSIYKLLLSGAVYIAQI